MVARRRGEAAIPHASSTGQQLTGAGWLDAHFEACRPEYEAIVRGVGIAPGACVLDAGCGPGGFLPLLADLAGPTGLLTAVDLAPDNIAAVRERLGGGGLPCPLETRVGSLTALPFLDGSFDAAWCANVLMYLTDEELTAALAELRRVLRPGGLLALKEQDLGLGRLHPAPVELSWHLNEAAARSAIYFRGGLRSCALGYWLERAGFMAVAQRTVLIERRAPLEPAARRYLGEAVGVWAGAAARLGLSAADQAGWRSVADPDSSAYLLARPDLYFCEGHVVATGRAPG